MYTLEYVTHVHMDYIEDAKNVKDINYESTSQAVVVAAATAR